MTMTEETQSLEMGFVPATEACLENVVPQNQVLERKALSARDIRHNMIVLILLDSIFVMGASDLQIVTGPLWKYLNASNTLIGLVGSLSILSLIGIVLAPFISLHCRLKKYFLLVTHLPYLGAWGLMGVACLLGERFGISKETLLITIVALNGANMFFAGFVTLPHQEYTAACIPMSHRGRFTGYSQSIGSVLGIASSAIGGVILLKIAAPMSYGWLFVMTWGICQMGYLLALLGREVPTPVEHAPRAWSRGMLQAFWKDKHFLKMILVQSMCIMLFLPTFNLFLAQYGLRDIGMSDATSATMAIVMQFSRIAMAGLVGVFIDRFSPKRILPLLPVLGAVTLLPAILWHSPMGVYVATGLSAVYFVGHYGAFQALQYGLPTPENRAGHYTLAILIGTGVTALGNLAVGALCDHLSYRPAFIVLSILAIVVAVGAHWLLKDLSNNPTDYA